MNVNISFKLRRIELEKTLEMVSKKVKYDVESLEYFEDGVVEYDEEAILKVGIALGIPYCSKEEKWEIYEVFEQLLHRFYDFDLGLFDVLETLNPLKVVSTPYYPLYRIFCFGKLVMLKEGYDDEKYQLKEVMDALPKHWQALYYYFCSKDDEDQCYFRSSLEKIQKASFINPDAQMGAVIDLQLASLYGRKYMFDKMEEHLQRALNQFHQDLNMEGLIACRYLVAKAYIKQERYHDAFCYLMRILERLDRGGFFFDKTKIYYEMMLICVLEKNYPSAAIYAKSSNRIDLWVASSYYLRDDHESLKYCLKRWKKEYKVYGDFLLLVFKDAVFPQVEEAFRCVNKRAGEIEPYQVKMLYDIMDFYLKKNRYDSKRSHYLEEYQQWVENFSK